MFEDTLPLITLIVFWDSGKWPDVAQYFFQSVGRQPHALEVVVIQRKGCTDLQQWIAGMDNVKHVCITNKHFWKAHRDYFCRKWGGCTQKESNEMMADMTTLGEIDMPESVYPTLRGWVFKEYVNPRSVYWGYCDVDTFMGDFSQTFPHHLAADGYDVIIPTERSDSGGYRLIFMRGHLTLFRNHPTNEEKMMSYHHFKNFSTWDRMGLPELVVGEGQYSHFVMGHPDVSVLAFDALAPFSSVVSLSPAGVLTHADTVRPSPGSRPSIPSSLLIGLTTPARHLPPSSDFTEQGQEYPVKVTQGHRPPGSQVWFSPYHTSYYEARSVPRGEEGETKEWRRYLMKRNGVWKERLEPIIPFTGHDAQHPMEGTMQWLYAHWQIDKKRTHWRHLPIASSPPDLFLAYPEGNAGFNANGKRVFWRPSREEHCYAEGCFAPDEPPEDDGGSYAEYLATRADYMNYYIASKQAKFRDSTTVALGADPSKPTKMPSAA
ncbi:hypothetical protein IAT38_003788 [Cryptococcus sp. DSM 104549]